MARKSLEAKNVQAVISLPKKIPEPPTNLTGDQGELWRMVMASPAGDMITQDAFPVLSEYCRCITFADTVAVELNKFDPSWAIEDDGLERWNRLLAMQDRLSGRISSLATKLRITPQTRVWKQTAGSIANKSAKRKPWQFEGD